jgi:outer membrane protein
MTSLRAMTSSRCQIGVLRFAATALACATLLLPARCVAQAPANNSAQTPAPEPTLTLRQAISLAEQNDIDIKVARTQYNVALRQAGVYRASFLPNLYTGSGIAYTYGFPALPGGQAPSLFELDYEQSIFDPNLKAQQRAAEEHAKGAQLEIDRVQNDVIARTATTYLELADVRHSLQLLGNEQASQEKVIEVTRERIAANQELPIEETRNELTLAQVRERLVKLENRNDILSDQLRDLTGLGDNASLEVEQQDHTLDSSFQQESDNDVVGLAMQNDEGIAEAEHDRLAKQDLLRGAQLAYYPTVKLVGEYSILGKLNNYSQFYRTFQRNNVNVGVQVSIPLFAATTAANVSLAKSQLAASEAALESKRLQVRGDIRQKQRDLRELDAGLEVANDAWKLSQQTLDLQQAKLQQGQATLADVEAAQLDENDKWVGYLDARFAQQKAQIVILQSTGQLAKVFQ